MEKMKTKRKFGLHRFIQGFLLAHINLGPYKYHMTILRYERHGLGWPNQINTFKDQHVPSTLSSEIKTVRCYSQAPSFREAKGGSKERSGQASKTL